jgi:hypothetical protein
MLAFDMQQLDYVMEHPNDEFGVEYMEVPESVMLFIREYDQRYGLLGFVYNLTNETYELGVIVKHRITEES